MKKMLMKIKCKLRLFFDMNVSMFVDFLKMSILALRGKIGLITSYETKSKGGYNYLALIISALPVSAKHKYRARQRK